MKLLVIFLALFAAEAFMVPRAPRLTRALNVLINPSSSADSGGPPVPPNVPEEDKEFDQFLAELVFSPNDVRKDIVDNLDRATPDFVAFLRRRVDTSSDADEKEALLSLADTVDTILDKLEQAVESEQAAGGSEAVVEVEAKVPEVATPAPARKVKDTAEILADMKAMNLGDASGIADDVSEEEKLEKQEEERQRNRDLAAHIAGDALKSYEQLIHLLLNRDGDMDLAAAVEANYEKCDIQFMALLEKYAKAEAQTPNPYDSILSEILNIADRRMNEAGETLQEVLRAGSPQLMQREIASLARQGKVDEPLLLVLEANIQQAKAAGASGPAGVLAGLLEKVRPSVVSKCTHIFAPSNAARVELDRKVAPEQALLRQLLRTESSEARIDILNEAFRPRKKLALTDGQETTEMPRVPPPSLIEAAKTLLLNFANIDESVSSELALRSRIDAICDEAERVATSFFGQSMTPREQQDRMMKDGSVSVWDLEKYEDAAESQGEKQPWQNDKYDWMDSPEAMGFEKMNKDGVEEMRKDIGGL
eukprot:scaffold236_cov228-Pinguiococcus_pyrenoidosus.AAC.8